MSVKFDFYIIHPSVVVSSNMIELAKSIEEVMSIDSQASILLENPFDFISDNSLMKKYLEFVNNINSYTAYYRESIYILSGETVYACSRRLIKKNKSICFIGFPYPELRSLHQFIVDQKAVEKKYAALDFNERRKSPSINMVKTDGKIAPDIAGIRIDYKPIDSIDDLRSKSNYYQLEPYPDATTPSSYIYTYKAGAHKMIMKSAIMCTPDYIMKMEDLIGIRQLFIENSKREALPQSIVYDNTTARGIVFDYIEGPSFEKLYHDTFYQQFMEKGNCEANLANRIYLLIQLYATICEYHSMGIYFSDVKGDNFIVTNDFHIIPIDTDGFSIYKYYSSCPRPEMMFSPEKDHKRAFLQNTEFERFSIMAMTYCFLMDGNYPNPSKKSKMTLKNINDNPASISDTDKGKKLIQRWKQYPQYVRNTLYKGLVDNKSVSCEELLSIFIRYYLELKGLSDHKIQSWISRKAMIRELSAENIDMPIGLFESIRIDQKQSINNNTKDSDIDDWYNQYINESTISSSSTNGSSSSSSTSGSSSSSSTSGSSSSSSTSGSSSSGGTSGSSGSGKKKGTKIKDIVIAIIIIITIVAAIIAGLYFSQNGGTQGQLQGCIPVQDDNYAVAYISTEENEDNPIVDSIDDNSIATYSLTIDEINQDMVA